MVKKPERFGASRGFALIAVILVMAMLSAVGSGVLYATAANTKDAMNGKAYKAAYYSGESAVNVAADALKKSVDALYNSMKSSNQITMDETAFINAALANAAASLPAGLSGSVAYTDFTPRAYDDGNGNTGFLASGVIEYFDSGETMRRRVGVSTEVKIMPLIRPSQVSNVVSPYNFPDSAALLSGGSFSDGGDTVYLYNGKIYLNQHASNSAKGSSIFEYDENMQPIPGVCHLEVKKGDGTVVPMDMSVLDWLSVDFYSGINQNAVAPADKVVIADNLVITDATADTYKNKTVFVAASLLINITNGGKNLDLSGARFFVWGSTAINLSGSTKFINAGKHGFDNCMIFSNGSVSVSGKPDNLYESSGPVSGMYLYTNGAMSVLGGNSSDTFYAVVYVKGAMAVATQVKLEGQIICEGAFSYEGNSNPTMKLTYNQTWTESFYNAIAEGLGGILPPHEVETVTYGDAVIDSTQIPYVIVGKVTELTN